MNGVRQAESAPHIHGKQSSLQLNKRNWHHFEKLFAENGGVWGGCWCTYYHRTGTFDAGAYEKNKKEKRSLVEEGHAHGTIVFCGKDPVGWCQFGPKEELPRVDRKRGYVPTSEHPWRITCFFIDKHHRRQGFGNFAVKESLIAMEKLGAERVEAYPVEGNLSATFLWSGTPGLFESAGFTRVGRLGKSSWVYSLDLPKS